MASYLIDTNVLLRAANKTSSQHSAAARALTSLAQEGHELSVTPQVLVEFWSVTTRPLDVNGFGWPVEQVQYEVEKILDRFALVLEPAGLFAEWFRLVKTHRVLGKKSHDARLAALCNVASLRCLTFNTADFRRYGVVTLSPEDVRSGS